MSSVEPTSIGLSVDSTMSFVRCRGRFPLPLDQAYGQIWDHAHQNIRIPVAAELLRTGAIDLHLN